MKESKVQTLNKWNGLGIVTNSPPMINLYTRMCFPTPKILSIRVSSIHLTTFSIIIKDRQKETKQQHPTATV